MKRLVILLISICISGLISNAQFTKTGAGLIYSTGPYFNNEKESDEHKPLCPAINIKIVYSIKQPFRISPSITAYLPRTTESGTSKHVVTGYMIDIDVHYVFHSSEKFDFYGLGGINLLLLGSKWVTPPLEDKSNETALGLNLGGGADFKLTELLDIFGEARYTLSSRGQFVFTAGILFNLKNKNKEGG